MDPLLPEIFGAGNGICKVNSCSFFLLLRAEVYLVSLINPLALLGMLSKGKSKTYGSYIILFLAVPLALPLALPLAECNYSPPFYFFSFLLRSSSY